MNTRTQEQAVSELADLLKKLMSKKQEGFHLVVNWNDEEGQILRAEKDDDETDGTIQ